MLKISDFYRDKQIFFIHKKILSVPCNMDSSFFSQQMAPWPPNIPHHRLWFLDFLKPLKNWYHLDNFYFHYFKRGTLRKNPKTPKICQNCPVLWSGWSGPFILLYLVEKKEKKSQIFGSKSVVYKSRVGYDEGHTVIKILILI